jgi:hypothetical protein
MRTGAGEHATAERVDEEREAGSVAFGIAISSIVSAPATRRTPGVPVWSARPGGAPARWKNARLLVGEPLA